MLRIYRISPRGLEFHLTKLSETDTRVECRGKALTMPIPIEELSQCWYNWQMKGLAIQQAFPNVIPEYREFFLTGITPDQWNEIFKEPEE